jgi:hypothetical protein
MLKEGIVLAAGLMAGILVAVAVPDPAAAQVLITEAEANLPPAPGAVPVDSRGITRGPRVEVVSPAKGKPLRSPLNLRIKFSPHGGAKIDPESVKVIYVKQPAVDLTSRVKAFTQPTGIELPAAELPLGDHLIRIDVKDSDGRTATTSFILKIAP